MEITVPVLSVREVTHDVRAIRVAKPEGYRFEPGQATDLSINKPGWQEELRPFTFTSLQEDPWLEFTIKCYTDHPGVTNELRQLKAGDALIIREPWGAISYKGPGYFFAGGAGITPFIAILRMLHRNKALAGNKLFCSNKTAADIIYEQELSHMLGQNAVFVLTDAKDERYCSGYMDEAFLKKHVDDFSRHCYICGPDKMITDISAILIRNGARPEAVVFEK